MNGVSLIEWWSCFCIFLGRNKAGSSNGKGKFGTMNDGQWTMNKKSYTVHRSSFNVHRPHVGTGNGYSDLRSN